MNLKWFWILGVLLSFTAVADCERELGYWRVGPPQLSSVNGTITFRLTNSRKIELYIDAYRSSQTDPSTQPMFDLLYHAFYENSVVGLGVTPDICPYIEDYLHQIGGVGGASVLNLVNVVNLRVIQ